MSMSQINKPTGPAMAPTLTTPIIIKAQSMGPIRTEDVEEDVDGGDDEYMEDDVNVEDVVDGENEKYAENIVDKEVTEDTGDAE